MTNYSLPCKSLSIIFLSAPFRTFPASVATPRLFSFSARVPSARSTARRHFKNTLHHNPDHPWSHHFISLRKPWPLIKMSDSEDDKPLVKGTFSETSSFACLLACLLLLFCLHKGQTPSSRLHCGTWPKARKPNPPLVSLHAPKSFFPSLQPPCSLHVFSRKIFKFST